MFKFITKLLGNKGRKQHEEDIFTLLIELTGLIADGINEVASRKGLRKGFSNSSQLVAYSHFIVYMALFIAEFEAKQSTSYIDVYEERFLEDIASSPKNVKQIKNYLDRCRYIYTSVMDQHSKSPVMFSKLAEAFIEHASVHQPIRDERLRKELINSISNLTKDLFSELIGAFNNIYCHGNSDVAFDPNLYGVVVLKDLISRIFFGSLGEMVAEAIAESDTGVKDPFENFAFRYELGSRLASLVDALDTAAFNDPDACIAMTDFNFAYMLIPREGPIKGPYVYLDEVEPHYSALKKIKAEGQDQSGLMEHFYTDQFANKALDIILKRFRNRK